MVLRCLGWRWGRRRRHVYQRRGGCRNITGAHLLLLVWVSHRRRTLPEAAFPSRGVRILRWRSISRGEPLQSPSHAHDVSSQFGGRAAKLFGGISLLGAPPRSLLFTVGTSTKINLFDNQHRYTGRWGQPEEERRMCCLFQHGRVTQEEGEDWSARQREREREGYEGRGLNKTERSGTPPFPVIDTERKREIRREAQRERERMWLVRRPTVWYARIGTLEINLFVANIVSLFNLLMGGIILLMFSRLSIFESPIKRDKKDPHMLKYWEGKLTLGEKIK